MSSMACSKATGVLELARGNRNAFFFAPVKTHCRPIHHAGDIHELALRQHLGDDLRRHVEHASQHVLELVFPITGFFVGCSLRAAQKRADGQHVLLDVAPASGLT